MTQLIRRGGSGITFDGTMSNGDLGKKLNNQLTKVLHVNEHFVVRDYLPYNFTNDAVTQEIGATLDSWNFTWAYTGGPAIITNQHIFPAIGDMVNPINIASVSLPVNSAGLTSTQTFTFSGTTDNSINLGGGTVTTSLSTTINFDWGLYYGLWPIGTLPAFTNPIAVPGGAPAVADLINPVKFTLSLQTSRSFIHTFDCSAIPGGANIVVAYPASWGYPSTVYLGTAGLSVLTPETVAFNLTNASGGVNNVSGLGGYIMIVSQYAQTGSDVYLQII